MTTADGNKEEKQLELPVSTEEMMKHLHNPRGLKRKTCKPLDFFSKSLPKIGQEDVWVRTGLIGWDYTYASGVQVMENDEQTVYFQTYTNLFGYICSCWYCQQAWTVRTDWHEEWGFRQRNILNLDAHAYRRTYIGHLGAILKGYINGQGNSNVSCPLRPASWAYINHQHTRGLLRPATTAEHRRGEPEYCVPEFADPIPVPIPEDMSTYLSRREEVRPAPSAAPISFWSENTQSEF